jgi:hypothetical protein
MRVRVAEIVPGSPIAICVEFALRAARGGPPIGPTG